jgi:hypothetical protein
MNSTVWLDEVFYFLLAILDISFVDLIPNALKHCNGLL